MNKLKKLDEVIEAQNERIAELEDYYKRVIEEECAPDEQHCTCVPALRKRIAELENERREISDSIKAKTDDGGVPDNLAQCVEFLMLQEYYPMQKTIERLTAEIKDLKGQA